MSKNPAVDQMLENAQKRDVTRSFIDFALSIEGKEKAEGRELTEDEVLDLMTLWIVLGNKPSA